MLANLNKYYEKVKSLPWVAWAGIYTLEIWLINFFAPGSLGWTPTDSGTFGDMFGAANSIFSAFAVIGVAWSVSMQRTELSIARDDRNKTRLILEEQQDNIKLQRFETTFFQLFTAFQAIIETMEVVSASGQVTDSMTVSRDLYTSSRGHQAINKILSSLEKEFGIQNQWHQGKDPEGLERGDNFGEDIDSRNRDALGRAYQKTFSIYGSDLGRYFRSLYIIINFVELSDIPDKDKPFYTKLVRAQLSQQESTLLALNYFSPHTTNSFNSLKLKYGMAKNANRTSGILLNFVYQLPPELFGRVYTKYRSKTKI